MSFTTDSDITPSDDPAPMPFSQALQPHGHMNACAISPESVSGKPAGKPSDMYQFGLLLYYMYTGNWPLAGLRQSMARNKVGGRVGGALADTGPPFPPLKRVRAAGCHRLLFHTFTELKPVQCFPKENTPLSREEHGASSYWMSWFGPGPYTVNSLGVRGAGSARCTRACDTATREAARRRRKEVVPTRSRLSSRAHHTKLLDLAVEGSAAARRLRTFTSPVSSSAFHAPTRSAGHDRPASGPVQLHPSRILKPVQRLHFPEPFFQTLGI
ncbi:MAG: hypothetical protein WDW38_003631 [Sanguina aurantia]